MFGGKLYRKYLGIAVVAILVLVPFRLHADMSFSGGGGSGGGGGAPVVTGQNVVNSGTGIMRNDASMIAGPVGAFTAQVTSVTAPSFTTDSANVVVFNVYAILNATVTTPPAADTLLLNQVEISGQALGVWAGYQTLASAGASGAQTLSTTATSGFGAVTIPFLPVTGQTIGISTSATRLQSTSAAPAASSVVVNVPSATANGDTLLACMGWYPNSPVTSLPTSQPTPATGTQRWVNDGSWYSSANSTNAGIQCWHKVASSEPASYTFAAAAPAAFIADLTNVQTLDVPMTSATGTFARGDIGKDLCIQGANTNFAFQSVGAAGGQGCGQIGGFSSATKIYPNFGNLSGSTISSKQYAYGADQGAAIQSAVNATATGGQVILGSGIYMTCGGNNTSTCLTFPTTASTILRGQGRALSNWGFGGLGAFPAGTGINNTNLGTYIIAANTDLSQPAWQWNPGTNSVANNVLFLTIEDLTLWGGVGTLGDGGGQAGFTGTNFSGLSMDRVAIGNFLGDDVDTLVSGSTGYTDQTHFDRVWFTLSGSDGWKTAGGTTEAQNEYMVDSQVDNNGKNGIELTGKHTIIDLFGNNIQRNDNFNNGSLEEIFCNSCTAWGLIEGNYFENDAGHQNAVVSLNSTGWAGVNWTGNFAVGMNGFSPTFSVAGTALPACGQTFASNSLGVCVTDATACTNGTTYTGSSTTHCRVQCNGTNWVETGMGC